MEELHEYYESQDTKHIAEVTLLLHWCWIAIKAGVIVGVVLGMAVAVRWLIGGA
ncbi:MAG: hypothetical protein IMZ61_14040 [Planctomycetes bacterium]|nr:hypothetical protein [Planctomycetota bacterium]